MIIVRFDSGSIPSAWKQIVKQDGRIDLPLKRSIVGDEVDLKVPFWIPK